MGNGKDMSDLYFITGNSLNILKRIKSNLVQCCITSPPYFGLRDYGNDEQIGLEKNPDDFIVELVTVFMEIHRIMKDDGILWINIGDSYSGSGKGPAGNFKSGKSDPRNMYEKHTKIIPEFCKPKDLIGIPWMLAFALRNSGWYLRQEIIWSKPNPMPESVKDRCTKSHEQIFMFTKSKKYYFDNEAIKEPSLTRDTNVRDRDKGSLNKVPGRTKMKGLKHNNYEKKNKRSVWTVNTSRYKGAHFATFPLELIEPCLLSSTKENDIVIDPFGGSGTVNLACKKHNRTGVYVDLSKEYTQMAKDRCK